MYSRPKLHHTIKQNTLLLTLGQGFNIIPLLLTPTIGPLIILQQTGSIALAGLASAITMGGRMVVAYHSGLLMDKFGRKKVLVLGSLLSIAGVVVLGFGTIDGTFAIFFSGLLVFGAGQGVIAQNRLAVADLYPAERRGQGLALFMSVSVVGVLASPLLLNLSAQYATFWGMNLYAVPWFFSVGILGAGLVTTLLVNPDPRDISENLEKYYPDYRPVTQVNIENEKRANAPSKITTILGIFPILVALAVSASAQGIMTMLMGLTSVYLTLHAVHIELVSLALAIHTIGMFGLSIPFGKITDHYGRKKVLLISLGFSTMGSILTPATTEFLIITLGIFIIGLGWSAAIVASTSVIADVLSPRQRGKGIGINDVAIGATAVSFPILGGMIFETSGFLALGFLSLIAIVPALILVLLLKEIRPGVYAHQAQTTP